jgi:DNA-directed RNA polymerase specialized sigma24 family protein
MTDGEERSVTQWIGPLKAGDAVAAENLWRRYFEALVRMARARLRRSVRSAADEEDVALSAFDSFCRGAARGRYPRLDDRDDLWRLLAVITERKAVDQAQREGRLKRGGDHVLEPIDADVASPEPTPEMAAIMVEECRRLLGRLRDDSLRQVAWLRMEGYSNEEVAERLGCSLRTVARKLELIRRTWAGGEAVES